MKSSAFYTVMGVGILVIICIVWWGTHYTHSTLPASGNSQSIVASDTPSLTGMSIYATGQYGFSIFYPSSLRTNSVFDTHYLLPNSWRFDAVATGTPILEILGYQTISTTSYPRYFESEIRIGRSDDPKELAACSIAGAEESKKSDTSIGGEAWKTFAFGDNAMMQYINGISYRTIHDGYCYAIEQVETGSDYRDASSTSDISDSVLTGHYTDLAPVVSTFVFAHP
jgi:hypothetical protein